MWRSSYSNDYEMDKLKKQIKEFESAEKRRVEVSKAMSERFDMDYRVFDALINSALQSDHETIIGQIKDLLIQTKLIHPEEAGRVQKQIRDAERQHQEKLEAYAQKQKVIDEAEQQHNLALLNHKLKVNDARVRNLNKVQSTVDDVYNKLKMPVNKGELTGLEVEILKSIATSNQLTSCGPMWTKVRWLGPPPSRIQEDSPALKIMESKGLLEKHPEEPQPPTALRRGYSAYGYSQLYYG